MSKIIELQRGMFTKIDDVDFNEVSKFHWWANQDKYGNWYAVKTPSDECNIRYMHQLILNLPEGFMPDHINGDTLDNTGDNLRQATFKQNSYNKHKRKPNATSIYKGVYYDKENNFYQFNIMCGDIKIFRVFSNELAAASAYNYYARILFKEFAWLNDIEEMEREEWEKYIRTISNSIYDGVLWNSHLKRWYVKLKIKDTKIQLTSFVNEKDCAGVVNYFMRENGYHEALFNNVKTLERHEWEPLQVKMKKLSKYRGVTYHNVSGRWGAKIQVSNKQYSLKYHDTEEQAALVYNQFVIDHNLDYPLNVIL